MRTSVVRHRSELGGWELVEGRPGRGVRGHVVRYLGYSERTVEPLRRREVPTGRAALILNLGAELRVHDRSGEPARFGSFVAGVDDGYGIVEHDGESDGVQIDLTPLAASMLLGVPGHELARRVVALDELLGPDADLLVERLAETPGWAERFDVLDEAIGARLAAAPAPAPATVWAWRRLVETEGRLPIAALADEVGCSRRHLRDQFRTHVGLPPKRFARVLRFRRVLRLLLDGRRDWAEVALDCGYYDQSHFNREFAELTGSTPTDYLARRLPDSAGVTAG